MPINLDDMRIRLAGSWARPSRVDADEHVTFMPSGALEYKVTPASTRSSMINVILGETRQGTWSIRGRRPKQFLDKVRGMSAGSSARLPESSLKLVPEALRKFAGYDPETGVQSHRPAAPVVAHPPQIAWLVLKTTNFADSRLNIPIGVTRVDLMNWFNDAAQIFGDNHHAVLALDGNSLTLRMNNGAVETWRRISRFLPDPGND